MKQILIRVDIPDDYDPKEDYFVVGMCNGDDDYLYSVRSEIITIPTDERLREWAEKVADIQTADNLADDLYIKVKILRDQLLKGGE